ncbi:ABC transporter permease [Pelagibacterium luteolum]|uniref:Autoinducer 2 import system permease protein LsrD n=1 Tax=Pelagibacterium luteolum TaxID=440168 RepID=A0A1G7T027_9HYPH|nr:ABC transporter permease [Pelagibacterium luteolum]SDG27999.1 simple sugar transport system permease protein [Pelagibacterium luteolum]
MITATDSGSAPPRHGPAHYLRRFLANPAGSIILVFGLIQIACIIWALLNPNDFRYLSPQNLAILMRAVPVLGCLALGVGVLMIAGEFDLSVGSVYALTAIVMAVQVTAGMSGFLAAGIAIAIGVAIGVLNGLITLRFNLPSFIVTLGGLLFWRGAVLLYNGAVQVRFDPEPAFTAIFAGTIFGLNAAFLWFLGLTFAFYMLLHHHRFGNHVFATGGNRAAATAIGINTGRVKIIAFAIAGGMAAVAGILATARVGSVQPGQGTGLELQAIAACVIGGLSLRGGRGSMIGVFLGVLLIHTITNVLLLIRAPGFYLEMFIAVLIVGASILNQLIDRRGRA